MDSLVEVLKQNIIFVMQLLGIVGAIFLAAYGVEKLEQKREGVREKMFTTRKLTLIGMFAAVAAVLMILELPMPFAPPFYKIDFSELPVLICSFAFGPVAGVLTEFVKIILKLLFRSTSTAFVGELANFVIGCSFILPASILYSFRKTKKTAIFATVLGTFTMTVFGTLFNAVYLLPKFAELFGMPLDAIIGMGTAINHSINTVSSFVILAVGPLNLLKGFIDSLLTIMIYKKLSPILKEGTPGKKRRMAADQKSNM